MDDSVLEAVVAQLREDVLPARIDRIFMSNPHEITFKLDPGRLGFLVIHLHPDCCGLYWTSSRPGASMYDISFLSRLRSCAQGGKFAGIDKERNDRVLKLHVSPSSPMSKPCSMIAQLFTPRPAFFLLDESGCILESSGAGAQRIPAGRTYDMTKAPSGAGQSAPALEILLADLCLKVEGLNDGPARLAAGIARNVPGLGLAGAREAVHRCGSAGPIRLAVTLREVQEEGLSGARLYLYPGPPGSLPFLSTVELTHLPDPPVRSFARALEATDYLLRTVAPAQRVLFTRRPVQRKVSRLRTRLQRAIAKVEKEERGAGKALRFRRWGELIVSSGLKLRDHKAQFRVKDSLDPDSAEITIPLDPSISLYANAQKLFRKAKKAQRTLQKSSKRLAELGDRLQALEQTAVAIERTDDPSVLQALGAQLDEQLPPARPKKAKGKKAKPRKEKAAAGPGRDYLCFQSSEGMDILVGRGARSNDQLTFKHARPEDFFLHAANSPGSHVIIKNGKRLQEPPAATLREAAALAAHHSKRAAEKTVEVHYTSKRQVRKPPGACPGLVTLRTFKTIRVSPSPLAAQRRPEELN